MKPDQRPAGAAWTRRVPFVLLLLAVGLAATGAIGAHRAVVSNQQAAEELIRDYGEFAAWTYQQRIAEIFDRTIEDDIDDVEDARWPDGADAIIHRGRDRNGRRSPGSESYFRVPIDPPGPPRFAGDEIWDNEELTDLVIRHATEAYESPWRFAVVLPADHDFQGPAFAYSLSSRRGGRPIVAYGMSVDTSRLSDLFARGIQREELLPPLLSEGQRNEDLLALVVSRANGEEVFATARQPDPRFAAALPLPAHLGALTVRVSVLPEVAEQLVIGGLPRSRTPLLLGVFALAAIMTLVAAGQLRREGELARLRSDFVASVSHELRTPLTQIRLYLDTMRLGRARTEEQRQWSIDNIDRETTRLIALVENVLEFSRSERVPAGTSDETCDLAEATNDVVVGFQRLVPSPDTRLTVSVPSRAPIRMDADSYRQILMNLLDNAIKYGPPDQVVSVAVEVAGDLVRVTVADQGPGVPAGERERVWQSFYRGQDAVGTVAAGSGIGLAVVRELVRRHDGRAVMDAAPGGGTRVVLEFPLVTETHSAETQTATDT